MAGVLEAQAITNDRTLEAIRAVIAGGGSSNMRIMGIQAPLVVERGAGCRVWDVEGNELLDLNMGYGAHLFGYADHDVQDEIADQLAHGHMTGLPHRLDQQAGELIAELVPSVEQVRFANSGTEAVASAVRLARATTGRNILVTFEGHYHGWSETVFRNAAITAGRGDRGLSVAPGAPGMIPEALNHTVQLPWNDFDALEELFALRGDRIAATLLEPICANSGVVLPAQGFLARVAELTSHAAAMLILDEVVTGFRVALGGAQELYSLKPDLTILSKVLGGGFPVAAFGGSRDAMALLAKNQAFHAGVYAGNHAAARAVVAQLRKIANDPSVYSVLDHTGDYITRRLREVFAAAGRPVRVARAGSVVSVGLLTESTPEADPYHAVPSALDFDAHKRLQLRCQLEGVYFHPNPLEPWFLSTAHRSDDLAQAIQVIEDAVMHV